MKSRRCSYCLEWSFSAALEVKTWNCAHCGVPIARRHEAENHSNELWQYSARRARSEDDANEGTRLTEKPEVREAASVDAIRKFFMGGFSPVNQPVGAHRSVDESTVGWAPDRLTIVSSPRCGLLFFVTANRVTYRCLRLDFDVASVSLDDHDSPTDATYLLHVVVVFSVRVLSENHGVIINHQCHGVIDCDPITVDGDGERTFGQILF